MSRQFPRTAAALAALTAGLLIAWSPPSAAQQSPDTWSAEHRAVLPAGLSVQFGLATFPGFDATAEPADRAVTADVRPRIRGEDAVAEASVEVREGDTPLCRAPVERSGDWNCRPGGPLAAGAYSLTPVETTSGGVVLRGEPVRITVKTAPPAASPVGADTPRVAAHETGPARWRTRLAGGLLLLAAIGLITRRVFARGPGARRR
ncbi:hypothetical protein ACWCXH_03820 [Kitasatospora sp. NPDC001660]